MKRFTSTLEKVAGSAALSHLRGLGSVKGAGTAALVADCHFNLRSFCSLEAVRDFDREHFWGDDSRTGVFSSNLRAALGVDAPRGDPIRSSHKGLREDATDIRPLLHPNAGYHGRHKSYFANIDCCFPGPSCPDASALGERCKTLFAFLAPYLDDVSSASDVTGAAGVALEAGMKCVRELVDECLPKMQKDLAAADAKFSTVVDESAKVVRAQEENDAASGVSGVAAAPAARAAGVAAGAGDGGGDEEEDVVLGHQAVASAKMFKYLNLRYTMKHRVAVVFDFLRAHEARLSGGEPSRFAESVLSAPEAIRAALDSLRRPATKISQFNLRDLLGGESWCVARYPIDEHCGSVEAQACFTDVVAAIQLQPKLLADLVTFFSADGAQINLIWHSGAHPDSSMECRTAAEASVAALQKGVPRSEQEALLQASIVANTQSIPPSPAGSVPEGALVAERCTPRVCDLERGVAAARAMYMAFGQCTTCGEDFWTYDSLDEHVLTCRADADDAAVLGAGDAGDAVMLGAGGAGHGVPPWPVIHQGEGDFSYCGVIRCRDAARLRGVLETRTTDSKLILSVIPLPPSSRALDREYQTGRSSRMPTDSQRGTGKRVTASQPMADTMVVMLDGVGGRRLADGSVERSALVRQIELLGCTVRTSMSNGSTHAITAGDRASIGVCRFKSIRKHQVPVLRPGWVEDCVKLAGRAPFGDHLLWEPGGEGSEGSEGSDDMVDVDWVCCDACGT